MLPTDSSPPPSQPSDSHAPPVLIVGAGPTGLMLACELTRLGTRCRIIDKAPARSTYSKALAVQARTLECFERLGVAERFVANGHKIHGVRMFSGGRRIVHLSLDAVDSRFNYVLVHPQSETERLLAERLSELGVKVEWNVELTGLTATTDSVEVTLRHAAKGQEERIRTPWLLGCDGAHSAVRHGLGMSFEGKAFDETFSLADVQLEGDVPLDEVSVYFRQGGILGLFPLDRHRRFRVILEHAEPVDVQIAPKLEEFQRAIHDAHLTGVTLSDPVWLARFRISQRQVAHYRQSRTFLLGDAAHIHSPMGGQGMNTGIQDACNLAWKLALVIAGRGKPELLDTFEQERYPVGRTLLRGTGLLTQVTSWRNPLAEAVRNTLASLMTSIPLVQRRIRTALSELGIHYRKSSIVAEHPPAHAGHHLPDWLSGLPGLGAGYRAPDATVHRRPDNAPVRLFELMPGTRHTLLLFAGSHREPADVQRQSELFNSITQKFGDLIACYVIAHEVARPDDSVLAATTLADPGGVAHRVYGVETETLYLVRPDGYIGFRSQPADAEALLAYLHRLLV